MLPDILNYVPDPKNGRPIAGGKVYFLIAGYTAPGRDSDLDITKIAPVTANGLTVPQPIYTSQGGTLIVGSQVDQPDLIPDGTTQRVAVYDKCGKLVYQVGYSAIGPFVPSGALAAADSTVLVGGVEAQYLNRPYTVDDYTVINPDVRRLAANAMSLSQTLQTVITGDSLSFNGYGYADFAVVGSGYATDQPFGMSSWSHLIRDLLFTANSAFTGLQDLRVKTTASVIYATTPEMFKNLGINAKAAFYNFTDTGKNLKVQSNYSTTAYLVVSYAPASDAVYFVVDGTEYDNETPVGENLGYGYLLVPTGTTETTITNVRKKTGGGSGGFWLYGITAQNTKTVKITGKGGYTSGQILSEYASLVGAYIPDVIYYIIGANDIDAGVPLATFSSNIESFISNARAAKSDCTIILISSVPSSAPSLSRSNTKPYIKAMRDIARDTESSLIDLYSKLETIPSTYWQFDSIHFNKQGDDLVFNIIKDLTLSQVPIEDDKFVPARESYLGAAGAWLRSRFLEAQEVPICFLIKFEAGTPIIVDGLSSNAAFTASLTLSYVADGSFDKSRIVCPPTHMVSGAQIVNTGADLTERVVPRFITNGQNFDFARVNSSGQQTIAGSNLFALINFVPLSS
jgi:lysophospholipase L1-like esterase